MSSTSSAEPATCSLSHVTLYKNNLGFFEHEGAGNADGRFSLSIPKAEKALVVDTLSVQCPPNQACMVNYDQKAPSDAADEPTFKFRLGAEHNLGDFLSSCVGAEIVVATGDDANACTKGQILAVEKGTKVLGEDTVVEVWHAIHLLCTETAMLSKVLLDDIKSCRINDDYLQSQLLAALRASLARNKPAKQASSKQNIDISLHDKPGSPQAADASLPAAAATGTAGAGRGGVKVSFIARAQEWKCSYRMDIPDQSDAVVVEHRGAEAAVEVHGEAGSRDSPATVMEFVDLHLLGKV
jgi:hypothetical protein